MFLPNIAVPMILASHGLKATVTLENWHLVLDLRDFDSEEREIPWEKGRTRLYDRENGVDSEEEVSAEHPEVTAELRTALIKWLGEASDESLGSASQVSEQGAENLRVLGYTGFAERTSSSWYAEEPDGGR